MSNITTIHKVADTSYWKFITTTISSGTSEPIMYGTIVNIVSNYEDLGIANEKRIPRTYLDVESQYGTCGAFTIESDYNVNVVVHQDGETTEPSGATQLRPFAHPGRQTWEYTNNQFSSAVEQWKSIRLDASARGEKFRYSIKIGDMQYANHGTLNIKPLKIMAQIKGFR